MEYSMIFAGFGGQGVLLAGQLIAEAAMKNGKNVTWMPSYGPEMRGGSANCSVVVSDDMIGSPIILEPNILVAMNGPSLDLFWEKVTPGGYIIYNSSLINNIPNREDVTFIPIPCNEIAASLGQSRAVNMPIIGMVMDIINVFSINDMKETMVARFGEKKADLIDINLKAIELGQGVFKEMKGDAS